MDFYISVYPWRLTGNLCSRDRGLLFAMEFCGVYLVLLIIYCFMSLVTENTRYLKMSRFQMGSISLMSTAIPNSCRTE